MFPRLSETFILNELLELERCDVPLQIFSLMQPTEQVAHEKVSAVRSEVRYLPERFIAGPLRIVKGQLAVLVRYPGGYLTALGKLLLRMCVRPPTVWPASSRRFYQACCLVNEMSGVVHFHAHYALGPARVASIVHTISGISFSVTTHAKDIFQFDRLESPRLQDKLGEAQFVIANCEYSARHLRRALGSSPPVYVVYNGIDLSLFTRRSTEPREPLILAVGRLVPKKGFAYLVRACRVLAQRGISFCCEIAGKGPLLDEIRSLICECGLENQVKLLGPKTRAELLDLYRRAAVVVAPCVVADDGDRDLVPNVVKEAMAVGVPVVTTSIDAMDELVEHDISGILAPPGDAEALADAMARVLEQPELRTRLADAGRTLVEQRFDRRISFTRLNELLSARVPASSEQVAASSGHARTAPVPVE
jgi:glycosyltransferase involved in cell wall biosynthesis